MAKEILIIRDPNNVDDSILQFFRNRYDIEVIDYDAQKAEELVDSGEVKLLVAFVNNISAASVVELRRFFMYTNAVHGLLLGTPSSLKDVSEFTRKSNVHSIELPLALDKFSEKFAALVETNKNLDSLKEGLSGRKYSVLIVDDDPVSLRNMMNWLKDLYQVSVVKSGAACLSFLGQSRPDLILLDYEMPICDGVQTLEMIRSQKEYADIPVMFLTGVSDNEKVRAALKLKPQGYILKNADGFEFLKKVNSFFQ